MLLLCHAYKVDPGVLEMWVEHHSLHPLLVKMVPWGTKKHAEKPAETLLPWDSQSLCVDCVLFVSSDLMAPCSTPGSLLKDLFHSVWLRPFLPLKLYYLILVYAGGLKQTHSNITQLACKYAHPKDIQDFKWSWVAFISFEKGFQYLKFLYLIPFVRGIFRAIWLFPMFGEKDY